MKDDLDLPARLAVLAIIAIAAVTLTTTYFAFPDNAVLAASAICAWGCFGASLGAVVLATRKPPTTQDDADRVWLLQQGIDPDDHGDPR